MKTKVKSYTYSGLRLDNHRCVDLTVASRVHGPRDHELAWATNQEAGIAFHQMQMLYVPADLL